MIQEVLLGLLAYKQGLEKMKENFERAMRESDIEEMNLRCRQILLSTEQVHET